MNEPDVLVRNVDQSTIEPMSKHGVWAAGYTNTPLNGYQPFIDCNCDGSFIDSCWEEVGRQFDEHLSQCGYTPNGN